MRAAEILLILCAGLAQLPLVSDRYSRSRCTIHKLNIIAAHFNGWVYDEHSDCTSGRFYAIGTSIVVEVVIWSIIAVWYGDRAETQSAGISFEVWWHSKVWISCSYHHEATIERCKFIFRVTNSIFFFPSSWRNQFALCWPPRLRFYQFSKVTTSLYTIRLNFLNIAILRKETNCDTMHYWIFSWTAIQITGRDWC